MRDAELSLAGQVINSLVGDWDPQDFENEYRRDLRAMLDAKLSGEQITRPEPVADTPVIDLMEALRRSVAEVQTAKKPKAAPMTASEARCAVERPLATANAASVANTAAAVPPAIPSAQARQFMALITPTSQRIVVT